MIQHTNNILQSKSPFDTYPSVCFKLTILSGWLRYAGYVMMKTPSLSPILPRRLWLLPVVAVLLIGALAWRWHGGATGSSQQAGPQAMPVQVMVLKSAPVRVSNEYSGKLTAVDYVQVRPQVSGTITKVFFEEGAIVNAGDPLFEIDLRPYRAAVAEAQAALNKAYSEAAYAREELGRAKKLVEQGHTSRSVYDQRASQQKVADAAIRAAQAQLTQANLNLEYATVTAPITGRISRAERTVGNLVEAGPQAPVLTTIVSHDKIYAEFDVDEQTYLSTIRSQRETQDVLGVSLHLQGDDKHYSGKMQSFDNQINPESGTIRARAVFNNDDQALVPGMYVSVVLQLPQRQLLMVPEIAIGTDQNKRFVYVADDQDKVAYREVVLGSSNEGARAVLSGLKEGERLIVSSIQALRPGMAISPMTSAPQAENAAQHDQQK